jgi:hypothetical protein
MDSVGSGEDPKAGYFEYHNRHSINHRLKEHPAPEVQSELIS